MGQVKKKMWDETQTERVPHERVLWERLLDADDGYREWSENQDREWREDLAEQREFESKWEHSQPPPEDSNSE